MMHAHSWVEYEQTDALKRFKCDCGAFGYRARFKPWLKVNVYKGEPSTRGSAGESVTMHTRDVGTNRTGGYLPPGGSVRRRVR